MAFEDKKTDTRNKFGEKKFEYAHAITTHLSQGSQYQNVLYLNENMMRTKEDRRRLSYTAITRAINSITIVVWIFIYYYFVVKYNLC